MYFIPVKGTSDFGSEPIFLTPSPSNKNLIIPDKVESMLTFLKCGTVFDFSITFDAPPDESIMFLF
jgi:hypothetical protein